LIKAGSHFAFFAAIDVICLLFLLGVLVTCDLSALKKKRNPDFRVKCESPTGNSKSTTPTKKCASPTRNTNNLPREANKTFPLSPPQKQKTAKGQTKKAVQARRETKTINRASSAKLSKTFPLPRPKKTYKSQTKNCESPRLTK
jgi:hypothetical protein